MKCSDPGTLTNQGIASRLRLLRSVAAIAEWWPRALSQLGPGYLVKLGFSLGVGEAAVWWLLKMWCFLTSLEKLPPTCFSTILWPVAAGSLTWETEPTICSNMCWSLVLFTQDFFRDVSPVASVLSKVQGHLVHGQTPPLVVQIPNFGKPWWPWFWGLDTPCCCKNFVYFPKFPSFHTRRNTSRDPSLVC